MLQVSERGSRAVFSTWHSSSFFSYHAYMLRRVDFAQFELFSLLRSGGCEIMSSVPGARALVRPCCTLWHTSSRRGASFCGCSSELHKQDDTGNEAWTFIAEARSPAYCGHTTNNNTNKNYDHDDDNGVKDDEESSKLSSIWILRQRRWLTRTSSHIVEYLRDCS